MASTRLRTPLDLGAAIRDARIAQSLTQADLARKAGVSREWLIGIEQGHRPRAELAKVLSVLNSLGLPLYAGAPPASDAPDSSPSGTVPRESITEVATRQAIDSSRTTAQVPAFAEYGSRAARLLNAGVDPTLAGYLTRMSMDLPPLPQPGHSGEGENGTEDGEEPPS